MSLPLIIGLDLGTSQVKVAAFRPDGTSVAGVSKGYPTHYPQPGWAEQAPADWEAAARAALVELVTRLGHQADGIAALGLSAHAPGLVPVDAGGRPLLERVPIWQDERSTAQAQRLLDEIGAGWVGLGFPLASFPAKLRWFAEAHPDLAREAALALGVKAYLAHWLTGHAATDPSSEPGNSASWQAVCRACGWSQDRLAPVVPASEVVGGLRAELARAMGLKPGLPVVLGLNDGASAVLGQGARQAGAAVITLATNGVIFSVADQPIPADWQLDQAVFCWPYVEGHWIVGGQTKTGASSLQWLLGVLRGDAAVGPDYHQLLRECANQPPGSHGVMFFPYLMGQGTPRDNPLARGAFIGLTLATRQADLTMAVLEGVAFTLREVLEVLTGMGAAAGRLHITGGGAQSGLWRQVVADVLDRSLHYAEADSCLGAAMLAAAGVGLHSGVEAACSAMIRPTEATVPRPQAVAVYSAKYGEFCQKRDVLLAAP